MNFYKRKFYHSVLSSNISNRPFLSFQNAFILIYLIYTFTSLVDLSGKFTDVAGVTHRISQLLERLNALEEFWNDLYPDDRGQSPTCSTLDQWSIVRQKIRQNLDTGKPSNSVDGTDSSSKDSSPILPIWTLENITFSPPMSTEPLVSNLSFEFVVGESVLITGTSSAGSQLLRPS